MMTALVDRIRGSLVWPMLFKELAQLRRDKMTLGLMVGVPALQIAIFGFLVKTQVENLPTVVLDESRSSSSRALAASLENTGKFRILRYVETRAEMESAIARGDAAAALVVPPEYTRDLARRQGAEAQLIIDASDPLSASSAISGASATATAASLALVERRRTPERPVNVIVRPRYNPGLRDSVNIVPGLIGIILTITLVAVVSVSLVGERERGTMEQLIVTPIGKSSIILGKILPFLLIGIVQMSFVLLLGRYLFEIPVRGSLSLLYGLGFLFMLAMLALGLLISTIAKTQAHALQLAVMTVIPTILLSGFMFPLAAMPKVAQFVGSLLPATHFISALRGILLKGAGASALGTEAAMLAAVAVALFALSVRRFAKTLE